MDLKILGSVAPYCKNGKNCPGYLLTEGKEKILLDCGNGITNHLDMKRDLENLTIFISNYLGDHYGDLFSIAEASSLFLKSGLLEKRIKLYLPELEEKLRTRMYNTEFFIEKTTDQYRTERINQEYVKNIAYHHFDVEIYNQSTQLQIGNMNICFYQTLHPTDTYAMKIESPTGKFVYSADTIYDEKIIEFFKDADLLLCEASLLKGQERNCKHLYAYEAAKLASKSHVEGLILTHFWPETEKNAYVEEATEYFKNVVAAEEGKVFKIKK